MDGWMVRPKGGLRSPRDGGSSYREGEMGGSLSLGPRPLAVSSGLTIIHCCRAFFSEEEKKGGKSRRGEWTHGRRERLA